MDGWRNEWMQEEMDGWRLKRVCGRELLNYFRNLLD
jgi:hypothetical protein